VSVLGRGAAVLASLLLLSGCFFGTSRKPFDYSPYVASDPRSVVVAPVAGSQYAKVQPDWLLSVITKPLAERGYYVMPVRMSQELAAQEGFSAYRRETTLWFDMDNNYSGTKVVDNPEDAERIKKQAVELAAYFGADSVLFVQLVHWAAEENYSEGFFANMIDEKVDHSIGLDYLLTDAQGNTIWRARKHIVYTRGGGGILTELWNVNQKPTNAQISTQLAREASWWMITGARLRTPKQWYYYSDPMLVGPYHPGYEPDRTRRRGTQ
jgi:hypothetical protein